MNGHKKAAGMSCAGTEALQRGKCNDGRRPHLVQHGNNALLEVERVHLLLGKVLLEVGVDGVLFRLLVLDQQGELYEVGSGEGGREGEKRERRGWLRQCHFSKHDVSTRSDRRRRARPHLTARNPAQRTHRC